MEKVLYRITLCDGESYEISMNLEESKYKVYWWSKDNSGCVLKSYSLLENLEDIYRWVVSEAYMSAFYGKDHVSINKIEKFN